VPISELRSIGIAGLLVTVLSVMLCTFIVPWVLGLLGHRINAARVRLPARGVQTRDDLGAANKRWVWWGSMITRRPWTALLVAGIPLLILAFQARKISPGVPDRDSLPAAAESVQALHTLQRMGRSGIVQSLRVILELPPQSPPLSPAGWLAVSRLTKHFESDSRAQEVLSLPALTGMADTPGAVSEVPEAIRKSFLRSDGQATLIELLPTATLTPDRVTFSICGCQSNSAQSALRWRFVRCVSCRFSGRPRWQTLRARRTDGQRIPDCSDSVVRHRLRIEHGL
jgi:RND superfamily putative drug exporter